MKKIYSYYQSIPLSNQQEEFACANWWKHSWSAQGWEPVMLNRSHAQASPYYNKLQQKLMQTAMGLPPEITSRCDWVVARYVRWCALHAAGGGWMSDYDVYNKGFSTQMADGCEDDTTLRINAGSPAYIFYATPDHCANAIKKFLIEPIVSHKVIDEADVLQVLGGLNSILPALYHAKAIKDLPRSAAMKNLSEA